MPLNLERPGQPTPGIICTTSSILPNVPMSDIEADLYAAMGRITELEDLSAKQHCIILDLQSQLAAEKLRNAQAALDAEKGGAE